MTEPLQCLAWFFPKLSLLWFMSIETRSADSYRAAWSLALAAGPAPAPAQQAQRGWAPAPQIGRKLACQVTRARARAAQAFASEERPRSTRPSHGGV